MATKQLAFKRSAQALNVSNTSTPIKATQSKIPNCNNEESKKKETKPGEEKNLNDIEDRVKSFEQDLKSVKDSIEFARAEVNDLKIDNEERKKMDERTRQRLEKLENENTLLNKSVIYLQARSMRDNS
jgi:chromosome segregation ATPase